MVHLLQMILNITSANEKQSKIEKLSKYYMYLIQRVIQQIAAWNQSYSGCQQSKYKLVCQGVKGGYYLGGLAVKKQTTWNIQIKMITFLHGLEYLSACLRWLGRGRGGNFYLTEFISCSSWYPIFFYKYTKSAKGKKGILQHKKLIFVHP